MADNLVEVSDKALARKSINPKVIIVVCTDNPTTMQAFRHKWTAKYPWILVNGSNCSTIV
jgi:hypothetical protein